MARRGFAVLLAGALAGAVVAPGRASAHGGLVVTVPAADAAVSEPIEAVSLTFTEKPAPYAYITVTAPTGVRVDGGWSNAEPVRLATPVREYQLTDGTWAPQLYSTGFPVKVRVMHWPAPGDYVVRYHTVASDGDQVKGELRFSYTGGPTPVPAGWQPPVDPPKPELLAGAKEPVAVPEKPAEDTSRWVWLVPVLLLAAAGLSYLVVRPPAFATAGRTRRRPSRPADPGGSGRG